MIILWLNIKIIKRKKDIIRQKEITNFLGCKFIRIKDIF